MTDQPIQYFFPVDTSSSNFSGIVSRISSNHDEKECQVLAKHTVLDVCFSPDNTLLAIDFTSCIKLFDTQTCTCIKTIQNFYNNGHVFGRTMCFSPDSKFFVCRRSKDNTGDYYFCLCIWNVSSWIEMPQNFENQGWKHMTHSGCRDFYFSSKYFVLSFPMNEFILVYDTTVSPWKCIFQPHNDSQMTMFSPDEKYIYVGWYIHETSTFNDEKYHNVFHDIWMNVNTTGSIIYALSPDGNLSAGLTIFGDRESNISVFRGNVCVKTIEYNRLNYHGYVTDLKVCFSSNGYLAVCIDPVIKIFSIDTWECILTLENTLWEGKNVFKICFSADGSVLSVMTRSSVTFFKFVNHLLLPLLCGTHSPSSSLSTMYNSDICERQVFSLIKKFL